MLASVVWPSSGDSFISWKISRDIRVVSVLATRITLQRGLGLVPFQVSELPALPYVPTYAIWKGGQAEGIEVTVPPKRRLLVALVSGLPQVVHDGERDRMCLSEVVDEISYVPSLCNA
ncbi:hypothetical protein V2G26_008730 [Clonostachys chloroleuca]